MKYKDHTNNSNIYDNGTPFDRPDLIYQLIEGGIINIKENIPAVIIIDGGQGSGKTTLSIHLTDIANFLAGKPEVDLTEKENVQYGLGAEQFIKKLPKSSIEGFPANIYDEGGDYSRKGALTKFNKALDQAMATVRVYKSLIFIICHDFTKLPKEMIDKQIATVLIHCKQRKPGSGYSSAMVYDYSSMCWIINYRKNEVIPELAYRKIYPNFHFRFKDLSPERSLLLAKLGSIKKKELWEATEVKMHGYLTYKDLASSLGKSENWIRQTANALGIEPQTVFKKKKYYDNAALERLKKELRITNA